MDYKTKCEELISFTKDSKAIGQMIDEIIGIIEKNGDYENGIISMKRYAQEFINPEEMNIQHVYNELESMGIPVNLTKYIINMNIDNEFMYELVSMEGSDDPESNVIESVKCEVDNWSECKEDFFTMLDDELYYLRAPITNE